ncbi:MAG: HEAT repeat domain-containing protein [Phycisphaerae bacterium]
MTLNAGKRILPGLLCSLLAFGGCAPAAEPDASGEPQVGDDSRVETLQKENDRLRTRVAQAMGNLYAHTPDADRDAMLLELLRDALAEVRRAGLDIVETRLASNQPVPPEARDRIRELLDDADVSVRQSAASLTAQLGGDGSAEALLSRLDVEKTTQVRQALFAGLGRLGCREALPAVLAEIRQGGAATATAAASALARIAQAPPLTEEQRGRAAGTLIWRYERAGTADAPRLREALLTAMGAVGHERFVPLLTEALGDPEAAVRLAAVNSLTRLGAKQAAGNIEPLLADPDRGVRQATIAAVATLGGEQYLPAILHRTYPEVEPDAAVRQQAWDVATALLADADWEMLRMVGNHLRPRTEALDQYIRVLQMLVEEIESADAPNTARLAARRDLGEALLKAGRPAEAAPHLKEAWLTAVELGDDSTTSVRLLWIKALLASNDTAAIAAIADCDRQQAFAEAMGMLETRLDELEEQEDLTAVIRLCDEALKQLSERITAERRQALQARREQAKALRIEAERARVAGLCGQLTAAEEGVRQKARSELLDMSQRALPHMLRLLRSAVAEEPPQAESEQAILAVLREIAPELTGYDVSAPVQERLRVIDQWIKSHP